MSASADDDGDVLRWYTSALRIPRLIGKLSSGERIWGGPYTLAQAGVGALALIVGVKTMPAWAQLHLFGEGLTAFVGNYVLVAGAAFGLTKLAGMIPSSRVNARVAFSGGARQLRGTRAATWRGQHLSAGRSRSRRGRINIIHGPLPARGKQPARPANPAPAAPAPAAPAPAAPAPPSPRSAIPTTSTPGVVEKLGAFVSR